MEIEIIVNIILLVIFAPGNTRGQCEEPLVLMPQNSSGNLAFPKGNQDPVSGTWNNNYLYPQSASCTWVIKAPPGHVINMRFLHFNTEEKFDYVSMFGSEDKTNQLFHYSGDLKEDWESATPDNTLVITFNSDEFTSYHGFQLAYRYLPKACVPGGFQVQENQLIALPPWNLHGALPGPVRENYYAAESEADSSMGPYWVDVAAYPQGLNCTWVIDPLEKHVTQVQIMGFHTNPTDVLQILQLDGDKLRPLFKLWDTNIPQSKILSTLPLTMNFISSISNPSSGSGFLLNITYISQACETEPQHLTTPKGYIAYPEANLQGGHWGMETTIYYGKDSCSWVLEAPEGYVLNITILQFDTSPQDKLTVSENGNDVFEYGGASPASSSILSESSNVVIRFSSEAESNKTGFLLHYSWLLKKCNYTLKPTEGVLKSPYYPDAYGDQVRCQWSIKPETSSQIVHFVIVRLNLDQGDFLQISDGKKNSLFTADDSTNQNILELHPKQSVTVNFLSDSSSNEGYFYMKFNVFEPGNCNFELTSCGWKSVDKMKLWNLEVNAGMVTVQEPIGALQKLKRGYQAVLKSPYLNSASSGTLSPQGNLEEPKQFCLSFTYLLNGQDAYKLKVIVEEKDHEEKSTWRESSTLIFQAVGPQGTKFLSGSVNFTASQEFQISIVYEKGYGPHYQASIKSMDLLEGKCQKSEDNNSINCEFDRSFCGWRNTHTDHQNWLLGDEGISTWSKMKTGLVTHRQHSDLVSPILYRSSMMSNASHSSCLSLKYQMHSALSGLKVLISSKKNSGLGLLVNRANHETEVWSVGGFESELLSAQIPIGWQEVPEEFEIILRAVTKKTRNQKHMESYIKGVSVTNLYLTDSPCSGMNSCNFEEGLCSWSSFSDNVEAWKIEQRNEEKKDKYLSLQAKSSNSKQSFFVSPKINLDVQKKLSFKYAVRGGRKQCLQVATTNDEITAIKPTSNPLWEQCKNKGKHSLFECIDLPIKNATERVFFTNLNNDLEAMIQLDDIEITDGSCTKGQWTSTETIWQCKPQETMCGMTQLKTGSWDWAYETIEKLETDEPSKEFFVCASGDKIPIELRCNGIAECPEIDDELNCGDIPVKETTELLNKTMEVFCADGRAINPAWICDGIMDCPDGSDESSCDQKDQSQESCSGKDFLCPTGIACHTFACPPGVSLCLSPEFVCDSIPHCNHGEDEQNCPPAFNDANRAWVSNPTVKDERDFFASRLETNVEENDDFIECYGGLLLPKSFRCDGRKDCPIDGRDEIGCHHCSGTDFLCPTSGVCIPWSSVCDGELSIDTCTDEDFCNQCPPGHFACDVCLTSNQICDGIWDCASGEDETRCIFPLNQMMGDDPGYNYVPEAVKCGPSQFLCPEGFCILEKSVCDRRLDCPLGADEIGCPNDNVEIESYIIAQHTGSNTHPSILVTPQFHMTEGQIGIISFQYRFDLWIGTSNVSISIEVLQADDTSKSLYPWSIWRQSVHKDQLWREANVIIPFIKDHPAFKLGFVVHGKPAFSGSEKIHLANFLFQTYTEDEASTKMTFTGSCDFEGSWCGWTQPFSHNGYGWTQGKVSSNSNRRTGPISGYGHGKNSGFIFADSQDGQPKDFAELLSPLLYLQPQGACLSVMVFMYGFDIGSLSILTGQKSGDHIFSKEMVHIHGSQGMSWFPVTLQINETHLSDVNEPFLLVIRAQKGIGTEGDIAIDHIRLHSGKCGNTDTDAAIFWGGYRSSTTQDVLMMKAGYPVSSYSPPVILPEEGESYAELDEFCARKNLCTDCVSSAVIKCNWCDEGHFCVSDVSPRSKICADNLLVFHNTSTLGKSGPNWCPQIVPDTFSTKMASLNLPINHDFAVMNIQPSYVDLPWKCVYKLPDPDPQKQTDFDQEMNFLRTIESDASNEELWAMLKGFAVQESKLAGGNMVEVSATFKGTSQHLDPTSNQSANILVGRITCGDGQTTLQFDEDEVPSSVDVDLITPSGRKLDNQHKLQVSVYTCASMASDCDTCMTLDSSLQCGWCQALDKCTEETLCVEGKWNPQGRGSKKICSITDELQLFSKLLHLEEEGPDFEDGLLEVTDDYSPITKKKVGKGMKKSLGSLRHESESKSRKSTRKNKDKRKDSNRKRDRNEKNKERNEGRKMKKKSFLRIPVEEETFVARSSWRLHTGRQYYVPVKTKTLVNLGFVRQVTYGKLEDAKSRTVLVEGKWKKAIGYYVDLFEKNDSEPVVSIITTKKAVFDQLLKQMDQKI